MLVSTFMADSCCYMPLAACFALVPAARAHLPCYHQVPVQPLNIPKKALITPFGLFEFLRILFGLTNAAHTFLCLMDTLLRDLPFLFVYLDDILVSSSSRRAYVSL